MQNSAFGIWGILLFVFGWIGGGFGVAGQPHIMVRYMAMRDSYDVSMIRKVYYIWGIVFGVLVMGVGLSTRLLLPNLPKSTQELALPLLSVELLPQILIGVVLAGIFSAAMSTADSQLLSCSATFTQNIAPSKKDSFWRTKFATIAFALIALVITLVGNQSVFDVVIFAWSGLAVVLVPILLLQVLKQRLSEFMMIFLIVVGFATLILWRKWGLHKYLYEGAIGVFFPLLLYGIIRLAKGGFVKKSNKDISQ